MSGGRTAPIPASRSGLREALETMGVASSKLLLTRCYGLSLSDHYWIKPADSGLTWHNVNFFENPFSEDVGDSLFGAPAKKEGFDFSSPDNTSDGFLKKRWKILDGKRCLIKAGSPPFLQQPFNEIIATKIAPAPSDSPHSLHFTVGRRNPLQCLRGLRHPRHGADPCLAGDANPEEGQPDLRLPTLPQLLRKAGCPPARPTPWTK